MKAKLLLKKWSSVSAAAAVLLGSSGRAQGSTPSIIDETAKSKDKQPFEPLILKPAGKKILSEQRFAGHVSHSSHASHASHYSGSGAYQPYAATPPPAAVYGAAPAVAPTSAGTATYYSVPQVSHRVELITGKIIYGDVQVKSAAGITLKGWDGKPYKFERNQLTARTIAELGLPEQQQVETTSTPSKLQTSNATGAHHSNEDLERTVRTLQADNAALRDELRARTKPALTTSTQNAVPDSPKSSPSVRDLSRVYWLSSTGERHNKNCRYYRAGSGHSCGPNDGVPCKLCGG